MIKITLFNENLRSAKANDGMYMIAGKYNKLLIVNATTLIFFANGPNRTSKYYTVQTKEAREEKKKKRDIVNIADDLKCGT